MVATSHKITYHISLIRTQCILLISAPLSCVLYSRTCSNQGNMVLFFISNKLVNGWLFVSVLKLLLSAIQRIVCIDMTVRYSSFLCYSKSLYLFFYM